MPPRKRAPKKIRLLADIGGTNARFALQLPGSPPRHVVKLKARDHANLQAAIKTYLDEIPAHARPTRAAFAVASPISDDTVAFTNSPWSFSIRRLQKTFGLESLDVINDFAAIALAVPRLGASDRRKIGRGKRIANAPMAVLGPGTGLGVSCLVPSSAGPVAVATEGGHVTLAPFNDYEAGILGFLRQKFEHVSAERALSGPGLVNLYMALAPIEGRPVERLTPATITRRALSGECPTSIAAIDMFCDILGTVASNLALSVGARGGVYIAGGIVPKLGEAFNARRFRTRFESKGRLSEYLAAIPTYLITRPLPAFLGLAYWLDMQASGEQRPCFH